MKTVQLLLQHGADVHAKDKGYELYRYQCTNNATIFNLLTQSETFSLYQIVMATDMFIFWEVGEEDDFYFFSSLSYYEEVGRVSLGWWWPEGLLSPSCGDEEVLNSNSLQSFLHIAVI